MLLNWQRPRSWHLPSFKSAVLFSPKRGRGMTQVPRWPNFTAVSGWPQKKKKKTVLFFIPNLSHYELYSGFIFYTLTYFRLKIAHIWGCGLSEWQIAGFTWANSVTSGNSWSLFTLAFHNEPGRLGKKLTCRITAKAGSGQCDKLTLGVVCRSF